MKVVKLTESDLDRIVERVLNEQSQEVTNFDKDYDYKKEGDNFFFKLKVSPVSEKAKNFKSQGKFLNWTKATGAGLEAIKTKVFKETPKQTTTTTTEKPSSIETSTPNENISKEGRNNPLWINLVSKLKSLSYPPKVVTFESRVKPGIPSQSLNWGTAVEQYYKDKSGNYAFNITATDSTQPIEKMNLFNSKDIKKHEEMHNWWIKNGYPEWGSTAIQIKFSDADKLKSDIESFFKMYPPVGGGDEEASPLSVSEPPSAATQTNTTVADTGLDLS